MYLVFVDFSENNSLLTEQLNVGSFYNLSVLNKSLIEALLTNFVDSDIQKVFLLDSEKTLAFPIFEVESIEESDFLKRLFEFDITDKILLVRNDIFFESDITEIGKQYQGNESLVFTDKAGFCYAILSSVSSLRRLSNKNTSFKDLFVDSQKIADVQITASGYTKHLNTVKDYKNLLFDILNGKTDFKPPYIAEGIFTEGTVPENDFSIIPPVYLGKCVQIESGSVIGPNTVILNNTLISSDTSIKNSVISEDVYVSSHCYVDGAFCCKNSSIKRNSAVFGGSVIGENALVGEDMLVENDSVINKNVKFDKLIKSPFLKTDNIFHNKFQSLSPDKAALLGSAIGNVFKKPRILIANDDSSSSLAVKLALLGGLVASGAECFDIGVSFKSYIFFCMSYCECAYSIFISGKNGGIDIEIFNSENIPISKTDCYNIFNFFNEGKFGFAEQSNCKPVRQIRGLRRMYIREITSAFTEGIENFPVVNCNNNLILKIFEEIKIKTEHLNSQKEKIYVNINDSGTKASIIFKGKTYSGKTLRKIVHFYYEKNQNIGEYINDYYKKIWKKDGIFLVLTVIYIIEKSKKDISDFVKELPEFFVETKTIENDFKSGDFARKFDDFSNCFYKNNACNFPVEGGLVKVVKLTDTNKLKILCASSDMSVSKEICNFISSLFKATDT